jgi:hypothetical protein
MLTLFDFVWRLYGVRQSADGTEWNCRLPGDAESTTARWGNAELRNDRNCSILMLAASDGKLQRLIGTEPRAVTIMVEIGRRTTSHNLNPDSVIAL